MMNPKTDTVSNNLTQAYQTDLETTDQDPFERFAQWLVQAEKYEPNDPNAMSLATVDEDGTPSARMVLLKALDPAEQGGIRGFVFYTNLQSRKGLALTVRPQAALLFHWKSLRRQVRIEGHTQSVSLDEADAYFASRPYDSQIGAWASDQSRPVAGRGVLERRISAMTEKYGSGTVERPPHWSGFRLQPMRIEFWQERPYRLHDRLVYDRIVDLPASEPPNWTVTRLFP